MESYNRLQVFPEVPEALDVIEKDQSIDACIFSNGTLSMIQASVQSFSQSVFKKILTVEDVQVFKPDQRTYRHLLEQYGKEGQPADVWLVSSNPFDVVGAVAAGLRAAWVDRAGKGWVDGLGDAIGDNIKPTLVAKGVDEAVKAIVAENSSSSKRENK